MRLRRALEEFVVEGMKTTIPLHQKLVRDPEFLAGDYTIKWLEQWLGRQPARARRVALNFRRQCAFRRAEDERACPATPEPPTGPIGPRPSPPSIAVHVALAAIILSGLNVRIVSHAVEQLKTFDIRVPPPPPPLPAAAGQPGRTRRRSQAGAPAKKAEADAGGRAASPDCPPPSPIPAAQDRRHRKRLDLGRGDVRAPAPAPAARATARRRRRRFFAASRRPGWCATSPAAIIDAARRRPPAERPRDGVALRVEPSGRAEQLPGVRSSGDRFVDGGLCPLIVRRGCASGPARDDQGRAIAYQLQYVATWRL